MGFIVYVEGRSEDQGQIVSYWHPGDDLGACIVDAIDDARDLGFESARPESVEALEDFTDDDWIHLSETLYRNPTTHTWDLNPGDSDFVFPVGVVPVDCDDSHAVERIREGFAVGDDGFIELVVDGRNIERTWRSLIMLFSDHAQLEVQLMDHWDDCGRTDVFRSGRKPAVSLAEYVLEHKSALLCHGGVSLEMQFDGAVVHLSDHKVFDLEVPELQLADVLQRLETMGFRRLKRLHSLAVEYHHYHYWLPGAPARTALARQLRADGFCGVDGVA